MIVKGYNSHAAMRHFLEQLHMIGFGRYNYAQNYKNGHALLKPFNKTKPSFYAIYKRDFFMSFEKEFPAFCESHPELKDVGESINAEALHRAITNNIDYLVFIHPDDDVYLAYPLMIQKFCVLNGLVRGQNRVNLEMDVKSMSFKPTSEVTFSFPKKLLKTFEEQFKVMQK